MTEQPTTDDNLLKQANCDTLIAGGGIAGLVCAYELLKQNQHVILIDRDTKARLGGLARWAFGGMALANTQEQKRGKIPDHSQQLLDDWHSFAEFNSDDHWPKVWAKIYAEQTNTLVYQYLKSLGLTFLPAVNWVERGLFATGNTLPRYHVLWGTGQGLVECFINLLTPYLKNGQLHIFHQHKVLTPNKQEGGHFTIDVIDETSQQGKIFTAKQVVIACGGINGSEQQVKKNCGTENTLLPSEFLNGANPISDGELHQTLSDLGASITHQDKMWNYAAGISHSTPEFERHGLSLIPCKSALWLDHTGTRIGPLPLVTGFDTHEICQTVASQEKPWTWQVLNWDIAAKELAVSGSLHNPSIRDKKLLSFLKEVLLGNHRLINQLVDEHEEVLVADSIEELTDKMNNITDNAYIDAEKLKQQIEQYDNKLRHGTALYNDDQVRRIMHARQWRPDSLRTCKPAPIIKKGTKLIAFKLQLITRKSLGGIQTNDKSQVLTTQGDVIDGMYSIGEAAGFGGGGANGKRSLEGTFLPGCILTARIAANHITKT